MGIARHPRAVDSPQGLASDVCGRSGRPGLWRWTYFCGAGGMSVGLTAAGYEVVLGVDNDPVALETYAGIHPSLTLCRDLSDPEALEEIAGLIRTPRRRVNSRRAAMSAVLSGRRF